MAPVRSFKKFLQLQVRPASAKAVPISASAIQYLRGGKTCWANSFVWRFLLFGRGVELERKNYVDTKVSEEGGGDAHRNSHPALAHSEMPG